MLCFPDFFAKTESNKRDKPDLLIHNIFCHKLEINLLCEFPPCKFLNIKKGRGGRNPLDVAFE